ncbi:MAG: hypothetical protein WD059_04770 [Balneolaceae bacterium]
MTIPAFWLRLEGDIVNHWPTIVAIIFATAPLKFLAIYVFGHHRRSWQYSSIQDLLSLMKSVTAVTIVYFLASLVVREQVLLPLSIPLIEGMLAFLILGSSRFLVRIFFKENFYQSKKPQQKRVLIAGAGDVGVMIAREMLRRPEAGLLPVAFLDDAAHKWNQKVMGIPVAGRISQMCSVAEKYRAEEVIIAISAEGGNVIRRIVESARDCNLPSKIIPPITDLISGKIEINQLRK